MDVAGACCANTVAAWVGCDGYPYMGGVAQVAMLAQPAVTERDARSARAVFCVRLVTKIGSHNTTTCDTTLYHTMKNMRLILVSWARIACEAGGWIGPYVGLGMGWCARLGRWCVPPHCYFGGALSGGVSGRSNFLKTRLMPQGV